MPAPQGPSGAPVAPLSQAPQAEVNSHGIHYAPEESTSQRLFAEPCGEDLGRQFLHRPAMPDNIRDSVPSDLGRRSIDIC